MTTVALNSKMVELFDAPKMVFKAGHTRAENIVVDRNPMIHFITNLRVYFAAQDNSGRLSHHNFVAKEIEPLHLVTDGQELFALVKVGPHHIHLPVSVDGEDEVRETIACIVSDSVNEMFRRDHPKASVERLSEIDTFVYQHMDFGKPARKAEEWPDGHLESFNVDLDLYNKISTIMNLHVFQEEI